MGAHLSTTDMACGVVSLVVAVQMLTPANPIGSTLRMFRQFRLQVCLRWIWYFLIR